MAMSFGYPIDLEVADDGVTVTFPDVPEAITGAPTRAAALQLAADCLEEALAGRIVHGREIPTPSPAHGRPVVRPGVIIAAKTALYLAMRERGTSTAALAEALGVDEREVTRMLSPRHNTRIDRLEQALAPFGQGLVVSVEEA